MVEIVEALAVGQQRANPVVARRLRVLVGPDAERVREGIDEECRVQDDHDAQANRHDEAAERVSDPEGDQHGQHDAAADRPPRVVIVLMRHQARSAQVLDVVVIGAVPPQQDPADVRVPEAFVHAVGIVRRVGVEVMLAVLRRPFQRRFLERGGAEQQQRNRTSADALYVACANRR